MRALSQHRRFGSSRGLQTEAHMRREVSASCLLAVFALALLSLQVHAQPAPGGPPAVGVVRAERQQVTQSDEFIGRIQAVNRVALVARITGFLEKRVFVE